MFYDCVASTSSVVDVRAIRMRCPSKKFASNNAIVDCFIGVAVATYVHVPPTMALLHSAHSVQAPHGSVHQVWCNGKTPLSPPGGIQR